MKTRSLSKKLIYDVNLPDINGSKRNWPNLVTPRHSTATTTQETRNVIAAFQTRYRPSLFDGTADAETAAMLEVITRKPVTPTAPKL